MYHSKTSAEVKYAASIVRNGEIVQTVKGKNLILDKGLADLQNVGNAAVNYTVFITTFQAGTGGGATRRDSVAITFSTPWVNSVTNITVTASAGFFIASDVNRILKLATGEELRINAFTSSTVVVCNPLPAAPTTGQIGTVWYVNDTALTTPIAQYSAVSIGSFAVLNPTTFLNTTSGVCSIQYGGTCPDSAAASGPYTVTELGWKNGSSINGSGLVGRVLLPSALNMLTGDVIRLTLSVTYTFDTSSKSVSAGAFSGTCKFYGATLNISGATAVFGAMLPGSFFGGGGKQWALYSTAPDLSVWHNSLATGSYATTSGSVFGTGVGNGTITSLSWGTQNFGGAGVLVHNLTTPQTKTNLQTLTLSDPTFTVTRVLIN